MNSHRSRCRRVIINVDDLGLSAAVNRAVIALAERGIVRSASLMSLGVLPASERQALRDMGVDIGLHLDFTHLLAHKRGLSRLIADAWLRRLDPLMIERSIAEQLTRFEQLACAAPRFVDGHQHIHQFPRIREVLFAQLAKRYPHSDIALRSTRPIPRAGIKAQIIYALGGAATRRYCLAHHIPHNRVFAGVYDFRGDRSRLQRLWQHWLSAMPERGGLIMCHPALADQHWQDDIRAAREEEYAFLSSDAFADLLAAQQIVPSTWEAWRTQ